MKKTIFALSLILTLTLILFTQFLSVTNGGGWIVGNELWWLSAKLWIASFIITGVVYV